MKRFHVHLHVKDLAQSVKFYSSLFAAQPTRLESDYAKWMLQDPPVNFAISNRSDQVGIDHLGIQTDNADELAELKSRATQADMALFDEGATTCCYSRSDKHWVTDPQNIAWEHFQTLDSIPVFREGSAVDAPAASKAEASTSACCPPSPSRGKPLTIPVKAAGSCC